MKVIKVEIEKYQTDDGTIHDSKEQAEHHEKILNGTRRVCETCNGYKTVLTEDMRSQRKCTECNGKGWQEKMVVWK